MSDNTLSVGEEIDLTGDGVPEKELLFTITDPKEEQTENGKRAVLTFENREQGVLVTQRYWLEHSNEQAQKIGRGQLRRVFIVATGSPRASLASLDGRQVLATPKEKDGFVNITRLKSADGTEAPAE